MNFKKRRPNPPFFFEKNKVFLYDALGVGCRVPCAAREALSQVMPKAIGLNVGGKIGVARCGEHVSVAVFFGIGLLHLNEVAIGTGHRVV